MIYALNYVTYTTKYVFLCVFLNVIENIMSKEIVLFVTSII